MANTLDGDGLALNDGRVKYIINTGQSSDIGIYKKIYTGYDSNDLNTYNNAISVNFTEVSSPDYRWEVPSMEEGKYKLFFGNLGAVTTRIYTPDTFNNFYWWATTTNTNLKSSYNRSLTFEFLPPARLLIKNPNYRFSWVSTSISFPDGTSIDLDRVWEGVSCGDSKILEANDSRDYLLLFVFNMGSRN